MPISQIRRGAKIVPLSLFLSGTLDVRGGPNSDGIFIGDFTLASFDTVFADDGGVYTNETTPAGNSTTADMTLLPATETTSDNYYFGDASKFAGLKITLSTAAIGTAIQWQYWNGTAWTNLATAHKLVDSTSGLTAGTSTYFVTWLIPTDWATTTINSATKYWVRIACTTASITTTPVGTQAWAMFVDAGVGIICPVNGKIIGASFSAMTKSATNNDSIFQIVNLTQGTSDDITFTKGERADTDTTIDLAVAKDDQLLVQMLQEDGTTEFANVNLVLNIATYG